MPGKDAGAQFLSLLGRKSEPVLVFLLGNNPVEGNRDRGRFRRGGLLAAFVRFHFIMIGQGTDPDRNARGGEPLTTLDESTKALLFLGNFELGHKVAGGVAHEGELQRISWSHPGRVDCGGAGKLAHVESILAGTRSLVGGLADQHRVGAIFRHHDRSRTVAEEKGGIVAGRQFEAVLVENGDIRIKENSSKPHAFHFNREALSLFALEKVVVGILAVGHALHSLVDRNLLGFVEVAVEVTASVLTPLFHYGGILAHPETSLVGHPALTAQTQEVFAKGRIGSDRDGGLDRLVLVSRLLKVGDRDPGLIEEDFLWFVEAVATEVEGYFGSPLSSPRLDGADGWGEGEGRESQKD